MTDLRWHKFVAVCRKCGKEITMIALHFSADNEFLVEGVCVKCGVQYHVKSDWATQILHCHILDTGDCGLLQKGSELVQ